MTIHDVITFYKKNIARYWKDEKYKWIAVQHFQNNWDIEAEDFAEMLEKSFDHIVLKRMNFWLRICILQEMFAFYADLMMMRI